LAALPGQRIDDIERVYSHVQALGQAEAFLRRRPWSLLTTYNTAGAGKLIAERQETGSAAVLSPRAASLFGLEVLAGDIQDVPDNRTRFIVIARPDATPVAASGAARRTTLVFGVRNEPGSLLRALSVFADRDVNLSRLESRPSRGHAWEYIFWTDADGGADEANVGDALTALREVTTLVRVLGSYPRATD
jgi:prephenate dehydratase